MTRRLVWSSLAIALLACVAGACTATVEPQNVDLSGFTYDLREYILADSSHFSVPDLCVTLADPPNPNSTALGSASLQFADTTVAEQQVRFEHLACSGSLTGDTVMIDQERLYRIRGTQVRVRRPRSVSGWYEDTGYVHRDTLDMTVHMCSDAPCATSIWRYIRRP